MRCLLDTNFVSDLARKLVAGLAAKYSKLTFCYEAGPTGYGLHRLIESLGQPLDEVRP